MKQILWNADSKVPFYNMCTYAPPDKLHFRNEKNPRQLTIHLIIIILLLIIIIINYTPKEVVHDALLYIY